MAKLDQIQVGNVTHEIVPEIAPLFNTATAYAVGDCVVKDAVLYRFKTAHAAGAWNAAHVDEITVGEELTSHGTDISELKADLTKVTNNYNIPIESGYCMAVASSVSIPPTKVANSNYACAFVSCEGSQILNVKGRSGSNSSYRMYSFYTEDGTRISQSGTSLTYDEYTKIITPVTARYVMFNFLSAYPHDVVVNDPLVDIVKGEYHPYNSYTVETGGYNTGGSNIGGTAYRKTQDVTFHAGTTVKMTAYVGTAGASTVSAITEWKNDIFVQSIVGKLGSGSSSDPQVGTVEVYFEKETTVRFTWYNSTGVKIEVKINTPTANAEKMSAITAELKSVPYEWERVLNSVCFIGDSLTRGAYYVNGHDGSAIDQNYPYFFGKQTGLTVQNEGVSGSSPSSRWSYFSAYDFTPYNAFVIWWGTNGGLTDTLAEDGVIDSNGNLIEDYTTYADTNTGDYCKTIGKIISQVPHAKIFLGTIYTTTGDRDTTNTVIGKIAALYPDNVMGVVNNNNDGTLYTRADKHLTPSWVHIDNVTHFSMVGNYYLAVHWIKAIRAIVASNPAKFENIMEDILA